MEENIEGIKLIDFDDFMKLDLRVAEIEEVEEIEGADKLWKLSLDVGELGKRTICAGIKAFYSKEDLVGRKIIYLSNLVPRKLRGVESQGMLLAASDEDKSVVSLLSLDKDVNNGARIG